MASLKRRLLTLTVAEHGLEALLGAAYLMTDRAFVKLSGDKKSLSVTLQPKSPEADAAGLAKEFLAELETQKVRWALAKQNQPIREFVAEQAVLLANGQLPEPVPAASDAQADQLTADQRAEIEKLIAEVEEEIKSVKQKKAGAVKDSPSSADPKNIKASWEETQQSRRGTES
jgi:His-Xaa-Ser system protein HxsD